MRAVQSLCSSPLGEGDHAEHGGGGSPHVPALGTYPLHRFAVPLPQGGGSQR